MLLPFIPLIKRLLEIMTMQPYLLSLGLCPPSRQFPRQAAWMLTEVLGWQQGVGTGLEGHRRGWSSGNHREVWQGGALQKIDVRAVVPLKSFSSAWEGR